jgi:hypothetical protein
MTSTLTSRPKNDSTCCWNWWSATEDLLAKLQADLREFIVLLNSHHVEYLLVGGHAVAFHGHPRFTGDIDFLVRTTPENASRVLSVLSDFGFADLSITPNDLIEPGRVLQLGHPPNRIDVFTSISGVDFDAAWAARVQAYLDDQPVSLLSREHLIQNKRASGRQKDLADVAKLLAVQSREDVE